MSIPEPAPAGGANIRPGQPQPKGRPTDDAEVICPVCTHHRCVCDDPDRRVPPPDEGVLPPGRRPPAALNPRTGARSTGTPHPR
jgi:hypothetical protein